MGVVKWLSWTCQLQTACQNATQAFPPPGGWCAPAMKTNHVFMRLMADEGAWGWRDVCGEQMGAKYYAHKHISNIDSLTLMQKWARGNTLQHSSVSDSSRSPHVHLSVNWFDAYGADNEGCEWMKVCHSISSSPLYAVTLSCLISTNHLLCISIYMREGRQSRLFYTCQT